MTPERKEPDLNSPDRGVLAATPGELITDGGEDLDEHDDVTGEYTEEPVEYYPDGFVSDEPTPGGVTGEYYGDSHLQPGYDVDPVPSLGPEDASTRPRGPPCRDCGEDMTADSFGWAPDTGPTVDWAECVDCGLGWGPLTGWVELDD